MDERDVLDPKYRYTGLRSFFTWPWFWWATNQMIDIPGWLNGVWGVFILLGWIVVIILFAGQRKCSLGYLVKKELTFHP